MLSSRLVKQLGVSLPGPLPCQTRIQQRLSSMGIETAFTQSLLRIEKDSIITKCTHSGMETEREFSALLLVTSREPDDRLFQQLPRGSASRIGDCLVPSSIADAIYAGHRFAREHGADPRQLVPRRERAILQAESQPNRLACKRG